MPLTDTFLRTLKAADKVQKYAAGGLYLHVSTTAGSAGVWPIVSTADKRPSALGHVLLLDARAKREAAKAQLAAGIGPGAHKKAVKEAYGLILNAAPQAPEQNFVPLSRSEGMGQRDNSRLFGTTAGTAAGQGILKALVFKMVQRDTAGTDSLSCGTGCVFRIRRKGVFPHKMYTEF